MDSDQAAERDHCYHGNTFGKTFDVLVNLWMQSNVRWTFTETPDVFCDCLRKFNASVQPVVYVTFFGKVQVIQRLKYKLILTSMVIVVAPFCSWKRKQLIKNQKIIRRQSSLRRNVTQYNVTVM